MSGALFDSVARIARHESAARALPAVGTVTATFGASGATPDHAVTVTLRDTGIVLPGVPVAVGALGFASLPATGDLVLVDFLDGDLNAPVAVGRLYTDAAAPPAAAVDGTMALELPAGGGTPALKLAVALDGKTIALEMGGTPLKIDVDDQKIVVEIDTMKLSVGKDGGGRVALEAGSTKVTLKKDGDLTVHTDGKLLLEGDQVEITGSSKVKLSGGSVEIN